MNGMLIQDKAILRNGRAIYLRRRDGKAACKTARDWGRIL